MTLKVLSSVGNDVLYGLDTDLLLLPCSTYEPHVGSRAGLNLGKQLQSLLGSSGVNATNGHLGSKI